MTGFEGNSPGSDRSPVASTATAHPATRTDLARSITTSPGSHGLAAKQSAVECRDMLGRFLTQAGYRFQTYLEEDENCVWRVHFFAGKDALAYLEEIAGWTCGPGDPLGFDPSEWLAGRSEPTP